MLLYKLPIKSLHKSTQRIQLSSRAQTSAFVQASYKKPTQIHPEGTIAQQGSNECFFVQASYKKRTQIHPGATIVPAGLKVVLLYKLLIKSLHKSTQRVQLPQQGSN